MAIINLRLKPPNSGFYMLSDKIINLEWTDVETDLLSTYEKANLISAINSELLENDLTAEELLEVMLLPGSVADIYREVLGVEETNECTLGDMSLTPPVFIFPIEGTSVLQTTIIASIEEMIVPGPFDGPHNYTNWQVSIDPNFFGVVASSYAKRNNELSFGITTLAYGNTYYIRAQFGSENLLSRWSDTITFNVKADGINRPEILYPVLNNLDTITYVTIEASPYNPIGMIEAHSSSDWEIATDESFTNIVWSSIGDTVNLESISVDPPLDPLTKHYLRVRYYSANYSSEESAIIAFTTNYGGAYGIRSFDDGEQEEGSGIALDSNGNIFIVGHSYDTSTARWSARILKLDEDHNILTSKKISEDKNVVLRGIAISSSDEVYICGYYTNTSNIHSALVMRFSNDLSSSITRRLSDIRHSYYNGMAISPNGDIICAGVYYEDQLIVRWDSNLNLITQRKLDGTYEGYFYDVAVDSSGNIYSVGYERKSEWTRSAYVVKWDSDLNILAQKRVRISGHGYFYGITIDANGDPVIVGRAWNDGYLLHLSSAMTIIRQSTVSGSSTDILKAVSISPDGDIYISGYQNSFPGGSYYGHIIRSDENFNILSQRSIGGIGDDRLHAIDASKTGSVMAVGTDGSSSAEPNILMTQMAESLSHSDIAELPYIDIHDTFISINSSSYAISNALLIPGDPGQVLSTDALVALDDPMTSIGNLFS